MKIKHSIQKGNVNGALWLLANIMSNGILQLTDESLHSRNATRSLRRSTAMTHKTSSSRRLRSY